MTLIANRTQIDQLATLHHALRFALDKGLMLEGGKLVAAGCPCYEPEAIEIPAELREVFASILKEST